MIHLVRHGETELNRQERVQGRLDSPLTALGRAQAAAIGARLAQLRAADGEKDWILQSSPLGRARQSAHIIAAVAGLPEPRVEPALIEVSYGVLEGLTPAEIAAGWPALAGATLFGRAPGGESLAELTARAANWLAACAGGPAVVAVTHAGFLRAARGTYLKLDEPRLRVLDKPQDAIFRLAAGREQRFDCRPADPGARGGWQAVDP